MCHAFSSVTLAFRQDSHLCLLPGPDIVKGRDCSEETLLFWLPRPCPQAASEVLLL